MRGEGGVLDIIKYYLVLRTYLGTSGSAFLVPRLLRTSVMTAHAACASDHQPLKEQTQMTAALPCVGG